MFRRPMPIFSGHCPKRTGWPEFSPATAGYHSAMTMRRLHYAVGNENNPSDPFGRSDLVISPDGSARLEHHFSRVRSVGRWKGHVDPAALDSLWSALERAEFASLPASGFLPGSTLRHLVIEVDDAPQAALIDWHGATKLPGFAEAFDVLDAVIRQLSGDTVRYPTQQPPVVHDIAAVPEPAS
jgi:hypothetical protein